MTQKKLPRKSPLYANYVYTEWDVVDAWYKTRIEIGKDAQDAPTEDDLVLVRAELKGDASFLSLHFLRNVIIKARKGGRCGGFVIHMSNPENPIK